MKRFTPIFLTLLLAVLFIEVLIGFPIQTKKSNSENHPFVSELEKKDLTPEEQKIADEKANNRVSEQRMQGVHLVESIKGSRDWELFADSAASYEFQGTWHLKKLKVYFYNKEKVEMTVTGDEGSIDSKKKDIEIRGGVVATSANGYVFKSEAIRYQSAERLLLSDEKILMTGPKDAMKLSGQRMQASLETSTLKIFENVDAERTLNNKKVHILSKGAEFNGHDYSAKFFNNVTIQVESFKIEGPEAFFRYREDSETIESLVVQGGVKVNSGNKVATADNLQFLPNEDKFIFEGKPKIIQNKDEIDGDRIVLSNGGRKISVENINANLDAK